MNAPVSGRTDTPGTRFSLPGLPAAFSKRKIKKDLEGSVWNIYWKPVQEWYIISTLFPQLKMRVSHARMHFPQDSQVL